jgi:chromosome segregation ATPase
MGRQRSQIEVVERQITVVHHDMEVLLAELGMLILDLPQPVVADGSADLYHRLVQEKAKLDDCDARIENLKQIEQSLHDAHARIVQIKSSVKAHRQQLRVVYARIGVIVWEEATGHVLSPIIGNAVPRVFEMQQKVTSLKESHESTSQKVKQSSPIFRLPLKMQEAVIARRLARFTRGHEEFFVELGQAVAQASCIRHLHSAAAVSLDADYLTLTREIGVWEEELAVLQQQISSNKGKLEQAAGPATLERKLSELQGERNILSDLVRSLAVEYGTLVCSLENPWKSIAVHAELLRCYDQIRRHERIALQLNRQIDELKIEQEIGELVYLIEQDEERVAHLRQLIDQYSGQIEEIQKSIVHNREHIAELKRTLMLSLEREDI